MKVTLKVGLLKKLLILYIHLLAKQGNQSHISVIFFG